MKKLFLGSVALLCFSLAILLFQVSCKKEAKADSPTTNTTTQKNKIVYVKQFYGTGGRLYDYGEIWTANYDGTAQTKLNITLPTNVVIAQVEPKISPDGQTIFFNAFLTDGTKDISNGWSLYSCSTDGSNVKQVVQSSGNTVAIAAAY